MASCLNCGLSVEEAFQFCPACGTRAGEAATGGDPIVGRTLQDKYRVLSRLGAGSMGTVYLAEHTSLKKKIAVKVLHSDLHVSEETLQRFQREGIAAGKFNHPNAIQIFDFDRTQDNVFFLAMEYVDGPTLKELIRERGPMPAEEAVDLARQVLSALVEAHRHGIVHRDLKPENIMVTPGSSGVLHVKVLDFGLSKLLDVPLEASLKTQTGQILGTPLYIAPEQWIGAEVDHRADIYAAGLILYELLAGEPPFSGENVAAILRKHTSEPAPSLCDSSPALKVPADLDEILIQALEKDPDDRFQSAGEMIAALEEVDFGSTSSSRSRRARKRKRARRAAAAVREPRSRTPLALAALALVVVGAGAGWYLTRDRFHGQEAPPRVSLYEPGLRTEEEQRYVELLDDARQALREREPGRAMDALDQAIRMECSDSEALLVRGLAYRQQFDDDTALLDFQEALQADPVYAEAAVGAGWIHYRRGDLERAQQAFAEAEQMDPDLMEAVAGQAAVALENDRLGTARRLLVVARGKDPDAPLVHYFLGRTLLKQDDLEGAQEAFIQAKRRDARFWEALAGLGEVYLRQERFEDAETQFRSALKLNDDAMEALASLASLLVDGERFAEALGLIEEALRRHPEVADLHILKGVTLQAGGRDQEAIAALQKGVEFAPGDAEARTLLGILLQGAGQTMEAVKHYRAAAEADDELALPHLNQGLAMFELEFYDRARDHLERAVEVEPGNAYAHYGLGVLYMDYLGDADRAREHLARYRELGGEDGRVEDWLRRLPAPAPGTQPSGGNE